MKNRTAAAPASASTPTPPSFAARRRLHALAPPRQRGGATPWVIGLLVLIAIGAAWYWHSRTVANGSDPAASAASGGASGAKPGAAAGPNRRFGGPNRVQPVSVAAARRQDIRVISQNIGSISADNTAIVHVQVSGTLQAIKFKEGQQIKAGDVLALIDPRAFQASLAQAEGALARDKAQLDNAKVDLGRYQDLMKKDAVAKQILDTQLATVRQLDGTVKVDQAAVDSARLQLSYTRVVAPISGRVGLKQSDLGNVVTPSDANGIVNITQTRPIALVFAVPSAQLPQVQKKLRANEPLEVEAWDRGGKLKLAVGKIATADNAIDPTTDTIRLKALFPNEDDALYPNQAVSVKLQLDKLVDVLAVPQAAVLRGAQGFYVYVVNADNSVSTRVVKTGAVDGDWVAVEGNLQEGETVVIDGVDRLRDGAKVEVIAADPTQRAGASAPAGGGRRHRGGPDGAASAASGAASGNRGDWAARRASQASPAADEGGRDDAAPRRAAPAEGAASGAGPQAAGEHPRLPPELVEKLRNLSPDERKAAIEKLREQRRQREAAASAPAP